MPDDPKSRRRRQTAMPADRFPIHGISPQYLSIIYLTIRQKVLMMLSGDYIVARASCLR